MIAYFNLMNTVLGVNLLERGNLKEFFELHDKGFRYERQQTY